MQNFLFSNLPELRSAREADQDVMKRSKGSSRSKTQTVRAGTTPSGAGKWAAKVQMAVAHAKSMLVDDGTILCVRDEKTYFDYIKEMKYARAGSIDTETTGLDPIDDHVVGLCLYTPASKYSIYVPSRHTDFNDNVLPNQLPYEVLLEGLREIYDIPYDYHNAIFDWRFIRNSIGIMMKIGWCTQIASNYLNEYESHQLKPLWDKYVSKKEDKSAKFSDLFKGIPFNYVPLDIAHLYGGKDPKITYELAEFQRQFLLPNSPNATTKGLQEAAVFLNEVEIPLIEHVGRMEDKGSEVDPEMAEKLLKKYSAKLEDALQEIDKIIRDYDLSKLTAEQRGKLDTPINIGSTHQLGVIFFDLLNLNNGDKRKPRSTDADALEYMRSKYPEHKLLLDKIQEHRSMVKLIGTYIEKMPNLVKAKTGRLHCKFNQYGARTGRFSSEGPNMQNIPSRGEKKEIRKIIKAREGNVFISADYSQQEPRVLAHLCFVLFNDTRMMDAYREGKDLYSWMASEVYGVDYDLCKEKFPDGTPNPEGKERRGSVKDILLGLMYGRSVESIAEQLGVSVSEAQKIVDMLFDTFPAIKKVVDYYMDMAREKGFITTVYGRKCRLPDMQLPKYEFVYVDNKDLPIEDEAIVDYYWNLLDNSRSYKRTRQIWEEANAKNIWIIDNQKKISEAERQVLNSVIQGTSADITKIAMLKIGRDEILRDLGFEMTLSIHDEIDGECPEENGVKVGERISEVMINACADKITVGMRVDVDISYYWTGTDVTEELRKNYAS